MVFVEPNPDPRPVSLLCRQYREEIPFWLSEFFGVPRAKLEDASQDAWLRALENSADLPAAPREERLFMLKYTAQAAKHARREAAREADRRDSTPPESVPASSPGEATPEQSLAILEAYEALPEHYRVVVLACTIRGFTCAEAAERLNLTEAAVKKRLWRGLAMMTKKLGDERNDEKRAAVIAPLAFELTRTQRAAFCAILSVEGRLPPMFGGGGPRPPSPPPPPPRRPPSSPVTLPQVTPRAVVVVGGGLCALGVLVGALLFLLFGWGPARPDVARLFFVSGVDCPGPAMAPSSTHSTSPAPLPSATGTSTATPAASTAKAPLDLALDGHRRPPRFAPLAKQRPRSPE